MVNVDAGSERAQDGGGSVGVFIALAPWVLFTVVAQRGTLQSAAVVALLTAVVIAGRSVMAGSPKLLELAAVASFAAFVAIAFAADASVGAWVERYARAIAAAVLALIAFTSLVTVPFTEQYAREQVPREHWHTPEFRAVNRQLTLVWALVFTAMVPCHVVAGIIDTRAANIVLNWVVPIMLVMRGIDRMGAITGAAER